MDKLNIIKNSIEQIREAIGEPCDHIENLPEKINELVGDASKVGYSTVFVFSNEENPNKPTGDIYENGMVSNLDANWSQTKIEDSAKVWMSFSLFKQSGGQVSDWVTPILITRSGKDGKDGKDAFTPQFKIEDGFWYIQYSENGEWMKVGQATGDKGETGEKGEPGKDGANGSNGVNGQDGITGPQGESGRGIISIEKLFAVNNDPSNYPTEGWTTIENVSTSSTNRYMWCQETTTFTSGDPTVIHYIVAVESEPGANGTGGDAPIIYPAGVWDSKKEYIAESDRVPYVLYSDKKYYMLNSKYLIIGEGEGSVWKGVGYAPGKTYEDEPIWLPIDSFEAIYSDIGLFNQALVGKWVFHGDYMFSQDGVGYKANTITKYTTYSEFTDPSAAISNWISDQYTSFTSKDWFKPNFLVNSKTGDFYASKGVLDNSLLFKSGESESTSSTAYNDIARGPVNLAQKQQWVLNSTNNYGTTYFVEGANRLPIAQVAILNLGKVAKLSCDDIKFRSGKSSGMLVLSADTLFQGMTYNGNCYCPPGYNITKCSGGVDGTVTYITPWDNPGYDLKVYDYFDDNFYAQGNNMTSINDLLRLSYSCPKVVVNYDSKTVTCQINKTGEDGELYFTAASDVPGQYQCYIDIYFYFNDLCIGRCCITGRYEIHDDQGVQ